MEIPSYLSIYLTVMANGPGGWTPEQVKEAYTFAISLIPSDMKAEVIEFSAQKGKFPLDKH